MFIIMVNICKGVFVLKRIIYVGILSALLLTACGEETVNEETPAVDTKKEINPVDKAVKSVTKKPYEIKQNDGLVSITIEDDKLHEASKQAILDDSAELFAELSKVEGITSPSIHWTSTLTDQYGNENIGEVLGIMFDAETFAKVNWDNYKSLDIESIASGYTQHETLKD